MFDKENFRDSFEFPGDLIVKIKYIKGSVDSKDESDGVF